MGSRVVVVLCLVLAGSGACAAGAAPVCVVEVRIDDPDPWHVHAPGRPFTIRVRVTDPGIPGATVHATWVNADGTARAEPVPLVPGQAVELASPAGTVGYYGLVLSCANPRVAFPPQPAGFPSAEYGFAILPAPPPASPPDPDSPFGLVQCGVTVDGRWDPYLRGHHSKTLTWRTRSPRSWGEAIRERDGAGMTELPLVDKEPWDSDDEQPVPAGQVREIAERFRDYVDAAPQVPAWELGLEENRRGRYRQRHYFANLEAKVRAIRRVLEDAGANCRLVCNFEGFHYDDLERLAASEALGRFDVLSLHPYRWKDFPSPESWLPAHIRTARKLLVENARGDMEIWLTEIGIPVRGNRDPRGFFGYPSSGKEVPGATRDYAARYLVKCHALALAEGVRRIYLYNYQNRGNDIAAAEHHFGLRSYTGSWGEPGFPLPGYVAFVTMLLQLSGKRFVRAHRPLEGVWAFEFAGAGEGTVLAWVHPDGRVTAPWAALRPASARGAPARVADLYGAPRPPAADGIELDATPRWITFRAR